MPYMRSLRSYDVNTLTEQNNLAQFTFSGKITHQVKLEHNKEEDWFADMLLLYMTVSCVLVGSSAGIKYLEMCYGSDLTFPFDYTPPLYRGPLYFTQSRGGRRSKKLMMDNGEAKNPRIRISFGSVHFIDLKETDEGTFSISFGDNRLHDVINLKILDCADKITKYYGHLYSFNVPRQAEYLEFNPLHSVDQPKVLWNRTNPQAYKGGRVEVKWDVVEITTLTQADSGYYNLRKKDNTLLSRKLLTVEANNKHYDTKVNQLLLIHNPLGFSSWTVTFTPEGETEDEMLVREGHVVTEGQWVPSTFHGRLQVTFDGIEIDPVESTDTGTFEFRDPHGNLAQTVYVEVNPAPAPTFIYVGIIVSIIFAGIVCCCCVKRCCCKKSSKREESAPAAYYHSQNQPAGPTYSAAPVPDYSYQPMNPNAPREPATTSPGPSVYTPVNIHGNLLQPEVAAPQGQGVTPALAVDSDFLSSDPEPTFELKGSIFPSAPPLSSDTTFCDVYNSDKLNFL